MPGVGRGRPGFSRRGRAKPAARSDIPVGFLAAQVAPSAFTTRWPNTPGHSAPGVTGLCPPIAQELSPGSGLARASGARIGQPQPAAIAKTSVVTRKSPGSPKGPQGSSRVLKAGRSRLARQPPPCPNDLFPTFADSDTENVRQGFARAQKGTLDSRLCSKNRETTRQKSCPPPPQPRLARRPKGHQGSEPAALHVFASLQTGTPNRRTPRPVNQTRRENSSQQLLNQVFCNSSTARFHCATLSAIIRVDSIDAWLSCAYPESSRWTR